MKKIVIILSVLALIASGCGQVKKKQAVKTEEQPLSETVISENKDDMPTVSTYSEETNKITIDRSFFETEKEIKKIYYRDSEYERYGITSLNTLGITSYDHFIFDDTDVSFSIISEIKLHDNIQSLIIRGKTEHSLGIWLVNYDLNKMLAKDFDYDAYIDSYPIGYDEWAEGASWITSVIYILPKPCIEREYVHWEDRENSKIEILKSGEFKIVQTIHSTHITH